MNDMQNVVMSPRTRRTRRGREGAVLDNVTAAPFVNNDVLLGNFHVENCPDEMVIFARGRRSIPLTFSPDVMHIKTHQRLSLSAAPGAMTRQSNMPNAVTRLLLPTRTSPRKRLTLTDSPPSSSIDFSPLQVSSSITSSPDMVKWSPVAKKCHLDANGDQVDASTAIKGLTKDQLVQLLTQVMTSRPDVVADVQKLLPDPDLNCMEERLRHLKKNISRSLPNTRLESKTDSMAYNRVATHLITFKKAILDQSKSLTEAKAWKTTIDYVLMAWGYVKATPVWDNPSHNNIRKTCFKSLASHCMVALKKCVWTADTCHELHKKFLLMEKDSEDIGLCIKHLDHILNNGNER